jgi:hypothetical protein
MRFAVYAPLLLSLLAGPLAAPISSRLPPKLAVWVVSTAAVLLGAAGLSSLALIAVAGLIQLPFVATVGGYSLGRAQLLHPVGLPLGLAAAVLLAGTLARCGHAVLRRATALSVAARRAAALDCGPDLVVVIPGTATDAYAIPGFPGRIVISDRLFAALDAAERTVVIAHERAHLQGRHFLFVTVAHCAAAANPFLRPLEREVEYVVERWADEDAAEAVRDRRRTATVIAKAALAGRVAAVPPGLALGILGRHLAGAAVGPVPRRVAALLAPPRRSDPVVLIVAAAGLLVAGGCAIEGARDLHGVLTLVGLLR